MSATALNFNYNPVLPNGQYVYPMTADRPPVKEQTPLFQPISQIISQHPLVSPQPPVSPRPLVSPQPLLPQIPVRSELPLPNYYRSSEMKRAQSPRPDYVDTLTHRELSLLDHNRLPSRERDLRQVHRIELHRGDNDQMEHSLLANLPHDRLPSKREVAAVAGQYLSKGYHDDIDGVLAAGQDKGYGYLPFDGLLKTVETVSGAERPWSSTPQPSTELDKNILNILGKYYDGQFKLRSEEFKYNRERRRLGEIAMLSSIEQNAMTQKFKVLIERNAELEDCIEKLLIDRDVEKARKTVVEDPLLLKTLDPENIRSAARPTQDSSDYSTIKNLREELRDLERRKNREIDEYKDALESMSRKQRHIEDENILLRSNNLALQDQLDQLRRSAGGYQTGQLGPLPAGNFMDSVESQKNPAPSAFQNNLSEAKPFTDRNTTATPNAPAWAEPNSGYTSMRQTYTSTKF